MKIDGHMREARTGNAHAPTFSLLSAVSILKADDIVLPQIRT